MKHDALLDGIGKNSCISRIIQCMDTGLSPRSKHSGTPKLELEVRRVCTIDGSPAHFR